LQPRSLELLQFLGALEDVQAKGAITPPMRNYEPGTQNPHKTWRIEPILEPLPDRPYVSKYLSGEPSIYSMPACIWQPNGLFIGQDVTESILRSHLEKHSCHVEFATRLESFEQQSDHVDAQIIKTMVDGQEISETLSVCFLLGCDGARGM
jgi:2-polyprenyl-6-methoxyphenol hydroxylase-like FAD-dependent oxidoreductase